jgi:uroporphyrinogen-III decarboxylase
MAGPGRDLFPIGSVGAPLWSNYSLLGFEGLMRLVLEDPGLVEYACGRRVEMARRTVARLKAIGARGVWIEECMTDMISPDAFRRLNLPFLREVVGVIRDAGMFSIYYYCGDPGDRLDLLIESGADAISLEESKKGFQIDITDVVDRVRGRCAVLGNLDAIGLLAHGSEADLCDEISRQLAAGRRNRGRFVMSLGSPVTPETPLRRVRLYADLVHRLSPG